MFQDHLYFLYCAFAVSALAVFPGLFFLMIHRICYNIKMYPFVICAIILFQFPCFYTSFMVFFFFYYTIICYLFTGKFIHLTLKASKFAFFWERQVLQTVFIKQSIFLPLISSKTFIIYEFKYTSRLLFFIELFIYLIVLYYFN